MSDALTNFSKRLKELRLEKDMGIRELASKLGMSHTAISQYERCMRTPSIDTCKLFADYFGTTCDYMIGLTDDRKRS